MALVIKEADLEQGAPVAGADFQRLPTVDDVRAQAKAKGIDPEFAASVFQQESSGNPKVKASDRGAVGGMQVMPGTFNTVMPDGDINNPWDNLEAGLRYIEYGQKKVGSDPKLLAAGYHQGYDHPDLQRGVIANTSDGRVRTPDYARQVVSRMGVKGNTVVAPTPIGGAERVAEPVSDDPQDRFMVDLARDGLRLAGTTPVSGDAALAGKDVSGLENLYDLGKGLKIGVNVAAQDLRELTRRIPVVGPTVVEALDKVDGYFTGKGGGTLLPADDEAMQASMSGKMQAALNKKWYDDTGNEGVTGLAVRKFGDAWLDWRSYAGGLMQSLPEQTLTMFPAMRLAKGVYAAKLAAGEAAGLTATAAAEKAGLAAARSAAVAGGVLEGTLQGAQSSRQVRDDILKMSESDLKDSDVLKSLMGQGMSFSQARAQVADDAATKAFILAGIATTMFAGAGDYVLAKAITGQLKGGIAARVAKGAVGEGVFEEFPQSGLSQVAQNYAMRDADPNTPLNKDALNQAFGGLAIGAVQGGGQTAIFGRGGDRGAAPAAGSSPSELAARGIRLDSDTGAVPATDVFGGPAGMGQNTGSTAMGATAATGDAEANLRRTVDLTALDRVEAIDKRLGELGADLAAVTPGDPEAAALEAERGALVEERSGLAQGFPKVVPGAETTFQTESGAELTAQYGLVEAGALVTSHDENLRATPAYPKELQPRERERAASEVQVSSISQKLNPARLGASADAATGAPIIGGDGVVESGNARTIALKRVYQAGGQKASDYRTWLAGNADRFGLAPAQVEAMQQPVLVRVRKTPVNRAEFARQANAPTTATMSPSETARSDAARLDNLDDVVLGERGDIARTKNAGFIKRFVSGLPLTEQAGLVGADGELSQAGLTRIRNAVLGRAYGDSPALLRMVESLDNNLRNITSALMRVAPRVAKARDSIKDGALHDADITADLVAAVEELSKIRERGQTVAMVLAQSEMFGLTLTPEGVDLLQFLDANMRYPNKIAQFIENYLDALGAAGSPAQSSLLGESTAPAKAAIISAAKGRLNEDTTGTVQSPAKSEPAAAAASETGAGGTDEGAGAEPAQADAAGAEERPGARRDQGGAGEDAVAKAAAQAKIDEALAELGEFIEQLPVAAGGVLKMLPDADRKKLLPIITKLFEGAIELGYIKFKEAAAHVLKLIGANEKLRRATEWLTQDDYKEAFRKAREGSNGDGIQNKERPGSKRPAESASTDAPAIPDKPVHGAEGERPVAVGGEPSNKERTREPGGERLKNLPVPGQQLFVERGKERFEVGSLEEAGRKWDQFRELSGAGASLIGEGAKIVDQSGKEVARISYNGKVWPPGPWKSGVKPLIGEPFKSSLPKDEKLITNADTWREEQAAENRKEIEQKRLYAKPTGQPVGGYYAVNVEGDTIGHRAPGESPRRFDTSEKADAFARAEMAKGERNEDVGENLWYNRRNFTGKALAWKDVEGLNDTLKVKEVVKAKVWPRPDYEQLVADGMQPFFARMLKQIYDGIGVEPGGKSEADLKRYIAVVNRVREAAFDWAKDNNANRDFLNAVVERAKPYAQRGPVSVSSMYEASKKEFDIRTALIDRVWPDSAGQMRGRFQSGETLMDIRAIGGQRAFKALQFTVDDAVGAMKDLEKGWPKSQEAWQRQGMQVVETAKSVSLSSGGSNAEPKYFLNTKDGWRGRVIGEGYASREEARAAQAAMKPWLLIDKSGRYKGEFDTEEAAKAEARNLVKREGGGGDIRGMNIGAAERTGPDRRESGENVSAQKLMDTFGLRGVNFGREGWINQAERQEYLNQAHDALLDLAEIVDVPPKALSLDGLLGIAFGAQGRGGQNAAHFVPGVNEINLTKTMGAGTLAHEWGHAFDHYFATQAGLGKDRAPYLSETNHRAGAGVRPEILSAFKEVVETMKRRPVTIGEQKMRDERNLADARKNLAGTIAYIDKSFGGIGDPNRDGWIKKYEPMTERLRNGDVGDGYVRSGNKQFPQVVAEIRNLVKDATGRVLDADTTQRLDNAASRLKYLLNEKVASEHHVPQTTGTDYAQQSARQDHEKGGKQYWSTEREMFARAFETYVADKLAELEQKNTFLSDAALRAEQKNREGTGYAMPYPRGEDRERINGAIEKLVDEIKTKETERGVAMFSRAEPGLPAAAERGSLRHDAQAQADLDLLEHFLAKYARDGGIPRGLFRPVRLPDDQLLQEVAGAFAKRVLGIRVDESKAPAGSPVLTGWQGVSLPGLSESIALREGARRPPLAILGHEFAHTLARDDPALYGDLVEAIRPYVRQSEYLSKFVAQFDEGKPGENIREEFVGEVLSDGFMSERFWDALGQANPTLLERVIKAVRGLMEKAAKAMGYTAKTAAYLTDFDAVMETAGRVMARYSDEAKAKEATGGEVKFSLAAKYEVDANGAPLLQLENIALAEPKEWGREGDQVFYEHVVTSGGKEVGLVSLAWKGDQVTQLHNIRTFDGGRRNGIGTAVLKTILTHNAPETTLWIRHVQPEARQWWANRGAEMFETEEGEDGTLTRKDFEATDANKQGDRGTASAPGETRERAAVGQGEAGSGDTGSEGRDKALSRSAVSGGVPVAEVQTVVDGITKGVANIASGGVKVVASVDDLPADAKGFVYSQGAAHDTEGLFDRKSRAIYLVAENLASPERAQFVVFHELFGHYGLRGMFGGKLNAELGEIWIRNENVRRETARLMKKYGYSHGLATEEVLADMAGRGESFTGLKRVMAKIQGLLREMGLDEVANWLEGMTDAEALAVLAKAREWVTGEKTPHLYSQAVLSQGEAVFSRATREAGIPVGVGQIVREFVNDEPLKAHPDYRAAKAGDTAAAVRLVKNLVSQKTLDAAKTRFGKDVIYAPVMAQEATGHNQIPDALAMRYAEATEASTENDIIQSNEAHYTGARSFERMMVRPVFDGKVKAGAKYVLVDDVTTMGGTFAELADHIRAGGGEVVGVVSLVNAARTGDTLAAVKRDIGEIERRFGDAIQQIFGVKPAALTRSEARYLLNFKDADALRASEATAIKERRARLDAKGLSGGEDPGVVFSRIDARASEGRALTPEQRADEILAAPTVSFKPLEAVTKGVVQLLRLDKVTSGAYDKLLWLLNKTPEKIKAGIVSDYGIPEAVTDRRVAMGGVVRQHMRQVEGVIEALGGLTRAESRVAYEWMNADNPEAAEHFRQQLPPESIAVLADVEKMIDKLSEEAIRLGQLTPEARDRNRFAYLRRSYEKHTAELTKQEGARRARAISVFGDQYKGRGIVDAVGMKKVENSNPTWWRRKLQGGKADVALRGEKFIRLERRAPAPGAGVLPIAGIGPAQAGQGRLLEVVYWPAAEPVPGRLAAWERPGGPWEVRGTKGGDLLMWRDFSKQERVAMGEIDEVKYAVARTLQGMIHDVEVGRYLEWLANTQGQPTANRIPAEKIVEAKESLWHTFAAGEFVEVPATKIPGTSVLRYGKLAGVYLPGPIWNDVRQTVNQNVRPLGEYYAAILKAWKISKTALSPTVHLNNIMANFVMADWHDVGAAHVAKALDILIHQADAANKIIVDRFEDAGGTIGTFSISELQREQLEPLIEQLKRDMGTDAGMIAAGSAIQLAISGKYREAIAAVASGKIARGVESIGKKMIDAYQMEDVIFRMAVFLRSKEQGIGDIAAGKAARQSFLDYHINAPWIALMRTTAMPFVSFTYRAAPMLLEVAAKKPWKLLKLGLVAGAANAIGYALSGGDEDKERKRLPAEKAGRIYGVLVPKLIRMPWNDASGSPVFLDIRRWVPVGDFFDTGQSHSAIPVLPVVVPGGPLAVLAELLFNKSQFTGKEVVKDTDTPAEKAKKVFTHLYQAMAPNLPYYSFGVLPETYAAKAITEAASGKTDAFGREQDLKMALLSSVGVKLGAYPRDVMEKNLKGEHDHALREIGENIGALRRELSRKGITEAEFEKKFAIQMAKRQELDRKYAAKLN